MSEWQPIETAPKDQWIVGLKVYAEDVAPAFVGKVYDMRRNALIDPVRGKWAHVSHWMPLPPA